MRQLEKAHQIDSISLDKMRVIRTVELNTFKINHCGNFEISKKPEESFHYLDSSVKTLHKVWKVEK